MASKNITAEDVVKHGVGYGTKLMGDDFIGYKFVGDKSEFWNGILMELHNNGHDVASVLNSAWLKENDIAVLEHDNDVW
jgi:hypothetical protein